MKFNILFLLIFIVVKSEAQSTVGEVKYSILPPQLFEQLNPGWILMDGRTITGSRLASQANITKIPDARDMFIRVMQGKRNDGSGDPETTRIVGSFQNDEFKKHSHAQRRKLYGGQGPGGNYEWAGSNAPNPNNEVEVNRTSEEGTSPETCPQNITLYFI